MSDIHPKRRLIDGCRRLIRWPTVNEHRRASKGDKQMKPKPVQKKVRARRFQRKIVHRQEKRLPKKVPSVKVLQPQQEKQSLLLQEVQKKRARPSPKVERSSISYNVPRQLASYSPPLHKVLRS